MLKSLNKMLLCTATPENLWDDTDEEDELYNHMDVNDDSLIDIIDLIALINLILSN